MCEMPPYQLLPYLNVDQCRHKDRRFYSGSPVLLISVETYIMQDEMNREIDQCNSDPIKRGEETMIRDICKDEAFLAQKAEPATPDDLQTAADLLETLEHHKAGCVGMAANMIGVNKRVIAFDNRGTYMIMFNPEIVKKSGPYQAEEGCLSLSGTRPAKRWKSIKVRWQNEKFQERLKIFTGWTAQIIQHEIDHCDGIIV